MLDTKLDLILTNQTIANVDFVKMIDLATGLLL